MIIKRYAAPLAIVLLLGSTQSFAQCDALEPRMPPPPMFRECGPPLPPEIREQIDQLREQEQDQSLLIQQKLQKSRHTLHKIISTQQFDDAAIVALAHEQAQWQAELLILQIRTQSRIRVLLDAGKLPKK
jgi:hypothetical protein